MTKERLQIEITEENSAKKTGRAISGLDKNTQGLAKSVKQLAGAYLGIQGLKMTAEFAKQAAVAKDVAAVSHSLPASVLNRCRPLCRRPQPEPLLIFSLCSSSPQRLSWGRFNVRVPSPWSRATLL